MTDRFDVGPTSQSITQSLRHRPSDDRYRHVRRKKKASCLPKIHLQRSRPPKKPFGAKRILQSNPCGRQTAQLTLRAHEPGPTPLRWRRKRKMLLNGVIDRVPFEVSIVDRWARPRCRRRVNPS